MSISKEDIINAVAEMSVMDVVDLISAMEEKFGVTAAAAVGVATSAADGDEQEAVEQTEFNVMLTAAGEKKVNAIKAVRAATGLGLKDAKTMVESVPIAVKEGVSKAEADELKTALEAAGCSVEVK